MNIENVDFFKKNSKHFTGRNIKVGGLDVGVSIDGIVSIEHTIDIRDGAGVTIQMDACDMLDEFGAESFDGIICMNTIEHVEHWIEAMKNMWGCLKIGGYFILTTCTSVKGRHNYPNDYWRFDLDELITMVGGKAVDTMNLPRPARPDLMVWIGAVGKKTKEELNLSEVSPIMVI